MRIKVYLASLIFLIVITISFGSIAEELKSTTVEVSDYDGGVLQLQLTMKDDIIHELKINRSNQNASIGDDAVIDLSARIVEANSADIDIVSGATYTSKAVIGATRAAIAQLKADTIDLEAWAEAKGYVKASDFKIALGVDTITGSSYKLEVNAQSENNLLTQKEARELTLDYLRGYPMYYHVKTDVDIGTDIIYVQSNIDLFEYLNNSGGNYSYGESYTGFSGRTYTYGLPSYPIDTTDYKAGIQFGNETKISDSDFVAAIGNAEYSYREMYAIGTSYNNVPGLAQAEAVLDPESMLIYLGSNPGSEKSLELAINPVIRMYWINAINEFDYVSGSDVKDNDYYHSYGVRIEGTAGAVNIADVIDDEGNVMRDSVVRGGIRYGLSLTGAQEWFEAHPDKNMAETAAILAETRYYADNWSNLDESVQASHIAEVRGYMAKIYLGKITAETMYPIDVAEIMEAGKEVNLANLKSIVMNKFMNRSGEGYAIRLASTGALLEVVTDEFLTNTLWIISDCATEDQVALYKAGKNPIIAKWAERFYELYTKLEKGETTTQLRRQVYYASDDDTLKR
jgi:hypothetical protein